jgi:hypothetical protein
MPDRSFVLDVRVLVRQGLVRMGAFAPSARVRFLDPATGRAWGEAICAVDTRFPDAPSLELRYELARSGERVVLAVPLAFARGLSRGSRWQFVCPLGCGRAAVRLHLPAGAARFGCRACHRSLLRRSDAPPAIRVPTPKEAGAPRAR